jgi:hypothetical protein
VSDSPALHSRWPLLLKIEISSNGQNCSILSQNVPKFEPYKHNDELFSMYDTTLSEQFQNLEKQNQRLPGACNRSPGSKLLSITTQLHCGGHLGGRAQLPDKNHFSKVWLILAQ